MTSRRAVARGISGSAALSAGRALSGILLTPLYFAHLDGATLGGWMLFAGLGGWVLLWDLGLAMLASRAFAFHAGSREKGRSIPKDLGPALAKASAPDLRRTLSLAYASMAGLLWVLAALAGYGYLGTLDLGPALPELRMAWLLYAAGLAVVLGGSLSNYLLQGCGDQGLEALLQLGALLLNLLASYACLSAGLGPLALAAVFLGQALVARAGAAWLARRRHAWAFGRGRFKPALLRELLRDAGPIFVTRLGALAVFQATPLLIASTLGAAAVPLWSASVTLSMYGGQLLLALPQALGPWVSARRAQGDRGAISAALNVTLKLGVGLALAWAAGMAVFGQDLMRFWLGRAEVAPLGLLALLSFFYAAEYHLQVLAQFTFSAGRWPFARPALIAGVLNLALACLLLPRWGLLGGALALALAQVGVSHSYSLVVAREHLGLRVMSWAKGIGLPLLVLAAIAWGLGLALRHSLLSLSWPGLAWGQRDLGGALPHLLGLALLGLLMLALAYGLLLTRPERELLAKARSRA